MKKFVILCFCVFLCFSCGLRQRIKTPKPALFYQQTVAEDDTIRVVQTSYYTVDSFKLDTIHKRPASNSERMVQNAIGDEVVDLNDVFREFDSETDWNYTELDPEEWEYLKKLGIYWDDVSECFRRRSAETHGNSTR